VRQQGKGERVAQSIDSEVIGPRNRSEKKVESEERETD